MIESDIFKNAWHVVYRSADLGEGEVRKVRLLGEDLAIWRWQGRVMAWMDLCIHRGARLSMGWVENGQIVCPYHGWRYDCDGRCTYIPAHPDLPVPEKARTFTYHAEDRYGFVWVCMGEPGKDIPALAEWDDADFVNVHTGPYPFKANAPRVVENVLDVTHFPFVHADMLGESREPDKVGDYKVWMDEEGLHTSPIPVFQRVADHSRTPKHTTYTFWCPGPVIGYLMKGIDEKRRFSHFMPITPVDDGESILWVLTSTNFEKEDAEEKITGRNNEIFSQDKEILESQWPVEMPLDLRFELHMRADKLAAAYRRWLKEIGVVSRGDAVLAAE